MYDTKMALLINQLPFNLPKLTSVTLAEITDLLEFSRTYAIRITGQSAKNDPIMHTRIASLFMRIFTKVGIPLNQVRQEVDSILSQRIGRNDPLSDYLKITNSLVRTWSKKDAEKQLIKILIKYDQA